MGNVTKQFIRMAKMFGLQLSFKENVIKEDLKEKFSRWSQI